MGLIGFNRGLGLGACITVECFPCMCCRETAQCLRSGQMPSARQAWYGFSLMVALSRVSKAVPSATLRFLNALAEERHER